jgi:hypothetical protein
MSVSISANTRWVAGEKVESTAGDPKMLEFAGPAAAAGKPNSCWQPQNQENNRLPLYSAYGLYNVAPLQGGKNLEFRPRTKFV